MADDPVLVAERAHLEHARHCLATMRTAADRIADYGVDELAAHALGRMRAERLAALEAEPDAPPFFGRTDRDADHDGFDRPAGDRQAGDRQAGDRQPGDRNAGDRRAGDRQAGDRNAGDRHGGADPAVEVLHIGRRHVRDDDGDPVVVDWRAPIARAFYRATPTDRMGVGLRRRFGFRDGVLSSFEDERLDRGEQSGLGSGLLRAEIERPRVGPMRDIVATIQPDQDELVRADLDTSLCVQGAPGTGKTAVGLHRAAYLLYTYPERLRRSGVLVVGPNEAFLHYIAQVLPSLGEGGISQYTIDGLLTDVARAAEPDELAILKGDARLAEVLRNAVLVHVSKPAEDVVALVGTRRYRIGAHHLRRYVDDARRALGNGLRWSAARDRLRLQVGEDVRRQREDSGGAPSDAETARVARSPAVRAWVDTVWPALSAPALLARLFDDPVFLTRCSRSMLTDDERTALARPSPRSVRSIKWTPADIVLLDELRAIIDGTDTFVHAVVDEAQDLSAMACRAVGRRCPIGSITVLGDLAQATTPWAPGSWATTLRHLGHDAPVRPLTAGYRVPGEVLELANRLLPHVAPGVPPATSIRHGTDALGFAPRGALVEQVRECLAVDGSIGVIVADAAVTAVLAELAGAGLEAAVLSDEDDPRVTVVPAASAKGLEFDLVIVIDLTAIIAAEYRRIDGLRRVYVVLTRAVSRLRIIGDDPLPPELA